MGGGRGRSALFCLLMSLKRFVRQAGLKPICTVEICVLLKVHVVFINLFSWIIGKGFVQYECKCTYSPIAVIVTTQRFLVHVHFIHPEQEIFLRTLQNTK